MSVTNITKEEYLSAIAIIKEYKEQKCKKYIKEFVCICCKKNTINPMYLDENPIDPLKQEKGMWENGTVFLLNYGYGSSHDLDNYYAALCDECTTDLDKSGIIIDHHELSDRIGKDELPF